MTNPDHTALREALAGLPPEDGEANQPMPPGEAAAFGNGFDVGQRRLASAVRPLLDELDALKAERDRLLAENARLREALVRTTSEDFVRHLLTELEGAKT